jgi:GYF domain 2
VILVEEQLFVRIRGHVQGPYQMDKLRSLVKRGQLSRMHEVSSDGNIWKQASEFPELFKTSSMKTVADHAISSGANNSPQSDVPELEPPVAGPRGSWYYATGGVQCGPVNLDELRTMIRTGSVQQDDLVWTEGMNEWRPARTQSGLALASPGNTFFSGPSRPETGINESVLRTLTETRPWLSYISTVTSTAGALLIVFGGLAIVFGARERQAGTVAGGGFSIMYAVVTLWAGKLLAACNRDIGTFLRDNSSQRLDSIFKSLRSFWIFTSIVFIVFLVNLIGVLIWAFSVGLILMH